MSPNSVPKFVDSFVDSAIVAGFAEAQDDGGVVLLEPHIHELGRQTVTDEPHRSTPPVSAAARLARPSHDAIPVVHQAWPINGGQIVFEIYSERPLPASAYATVGEVVTNLERLSLTLAPPETAAEVVADAETAE